MVEHDASINIFTHNNFSVLRMISLEKVTQKEFLCRRVQHKKKKMMFFRVGKGLQNCL